MCGIAPRKAAMSLANTPVVAADSFLTLHYRIATAAGEEFVSTFGLSPATLQMGSGQLNPLLESHLLGLPAGERHEFTLPPEQAFGQRNPQLVERIALTALPVGMDLRENALLEFTAPDGTAFSGFLRQLGADSALFDFNHPLAGQEIRFAVEIIGIL